MAPASEHCAAESDFLVCGTNDGSEGERDARHCQGRSPLALLPALHSAVVGLHHGAVRGDGAEHDGLELRLLQARLLVEQRQRRSHLQVGSLTVGSGGRFSQCLFMSLSQHSETTYVRGVLLAGHCMAESGTTAETTVHHTQRCDLCLQTQHEKVAVTP